MKHAINELEYALLDAAVAKAEGKAVVERRGMYWIEWPQCDEDADVDEFDRLTRKGYDAYQPSSDWCEGGPIIEREEIAVINENYGSITKWSAWVQGWMSNDGMDGLAHGTGPTVLVAAMRAYVTSRLGHWVELP